MKLSEALSYIFTVYAICFISIWFGMAIALQGCVNHGDNGFKHKLFEESVVCKVKK